MTILAGALKRVSICWMAAGAVALMAGCSTSTPVAGLKNTKTKEYFSEAEYGVAASPRVSGKKSGLRRGGGRYQVGKPYKVRGKWYKPRVDPDYSKTGSASWYGDAFHGRLTANGEVYDMTHLTAAHPTMPLPSYARVTNLKNNNSIIVRVNDRGPFAHNRIIDLSKRAANLLDYTNSGVAKVKVDYMGPAPLHGRDDQYLMASYRPGGHTPEQDQGFGGTMIAMAGPTPTAGMAPKTPGFPGELRNAVSSDMTAPAAGEPSLPSYGPLIPERPRYDLAAVPGRGSLPVMSYADRRVSEAARALDGLSRSGMTPADILASVKRDGGHAAGADTAFISVGTFSTRREADAMADGLGGIGRTSIARDTLDGSDVYSVELQGRDGGSLSGMLERAWALGAADAFIVRD